MQIKLLERNPDAVIVKRIPDREENGAAHIGDAIGRIVDPEAQIEVHGALAEFDEIADTIIRSDLSVATL